ncbi:MAG: ferrochelatase, partial [Ilumatobacteraceae bacterium]
LRRDTRRRGLRHGRRSRRAEGRHRGASFPLAGDRYPDELRSTATAVAARVGLDAGAWEIAWQSAGRTPEPWLGPDVLEVIDRVAADGGTGVLVSAVGFVADHLEVLYDLDIEASHRAASHGLAFARTACVNDDAQVIAALAQRVIELDR